MEATLQSYLSAAVPCLFDLILLDLEYAVSEPEEEDFAAMFEASVKTRRFSRGQTIEGTIVSIGPEVTLVNVGGKGEAVIESAELKDDEGGIEVSVGDRLRAVVVGTTGGITLSRKMLRGAASARQLSGSAWRWSRMARKSATARRWTR